MNIMDIKPFNKKGLINVIIETPKGNRNKYAYNIKQNLYTLKGILPIGNTFPFDFGFITGTLGPDGDPLDVLILMDEPAFTGCHLECRCIGGIKAIQTEKQKSERNDRIIAVYDKSSLFKEINEITQLDKNLFIDIQTFFISYNERLGRKFEIKKKINSKEAHKIIQSLTI